MHLLVARRARRARKTRRKSPAKVWCDNFARPQRLLRTNVVNTNTRARTGAAAPEVIVAGPQDWTEQPRNGEGKCLPKVMVVFTAVAFERRCVPFTWARAHADASGQLRVICNSSVY